MSKSITPIGRFTAREWVLWIGSLVIVIAANILSPEFDLLTLIASLVGVTSIIFGAKGHVSSQILMTIFSILYGVISWRFRYWGEMVTYLGMTMPMAIWSTITWFRNPSPENGSQVKIRKVTPRGWGILAVVTVAVTAAFYFILGALATPNLIFSTLSVATSFVAASLTMLRSSYFSLFYAGNDVVLIVLWVLASIGAPVYIPVIVIFAIFLVNDVYAFVSWKRREE